MNQGNMLIKKLIYTKGKLTTHKNMSPSHTQVTMAFNKHALFHPDFNRRLRNYTSSA